MQSASLGLLSQEKASDLKKVLKTSVETFIKGAAERATVEYVFKRVLLMKRGGIEIDGVRWFHDRVKAISADIGESMRTTERVVADLRDQDLIVSQPRWRTEKGTPRRVNHWTLGERLINLLLIGFGLKTYGPAEPPEAPQAVASTAVMADDQPADMADHGPANLAVPNKETLLPSTASNSLLRVAAPAPQAPPEPTAEQPENRNEKQEQPSPEKHGVRRVEPRFDVMADRQKAEKAHQDTPVEQIEAGLALVRAMCSGLKPAHSA